MNKPIPKYPRILAIALSTRGFGFAVLEGNQILADWGVKSIEGDKNKGSLSKLKEMIVHYEPDVLVLENTSIKPMRRSARIQTLTKQVSSVAEKSNIPVRLFSREHTRRFFFGDGKETKHDIAKIIAERFSDELGFRLPPKRRP